MIKLQLSAVVCVSMYNTYVFPWGFTYRGGGHAASVSQPFLHPHRGVKESLHAEISEDWPEVPAHLTVGLKLLIKREPLCLLQWQHMFEYSLTSHFSQNPEIQWYKQTNLRHNLCLPQISKKPKTQKQMKIDKHSEQLFARLIPEIVFFFPPTSQCWKE